jgi:alpha-mannosidase
VRRGYEFNYKPEVLVMAPHEGDLPAEHSFVSVQPQNVVLTALKKAEDSDALIAHVYEWAGQPANVEITVPKGAIGAAETNLLETAAASSPTLTAQKITIPIHPYEILVLRIDYPHNTSPR